MTLRNKIFILVLLLANLRLAAQVPDSVDVTSDFYRTFTEDDIFSGYSTKFRPLDTTVTDFHIANPVIRRYNINTTLGTTGQPFRNPVGIPYRGLGFDLGFHQLSIWEQSKNTVTHYRSRAPFIEANYFNGTKKEQNFFLNLNQNITKTWNVGLRFERLTSAGFYQRQATDNTTWLIYSSYESKSGKYRLALSGARNNLKAQLNGGVKEMESFTGDTESNRQLLDVNLNSASNTWRTRYISLQQSFDLKRWGDTLANKKDTVKLPARNALRMYHIFDLQSKALLYNDTLAVPDSFYTAFQFDTTNTHDQTNNTLIDNRFGLKLIAEKQRRDPRLLDVYAGHQFIKYKTYNNSVGDSVAIEDMSNNAYVGGNLRLPLLKGWGISGSATIFLLGYNIGDYEGRFYIFSSQKDTLDNVKSRLEVGVLVKAYRPTYLQSNYMSNHFSWETDFTKTFANSLFANYTNVKLKLNASAWVTDMRGFVYFNQSAMPQQANEGVVVFAAQANKNFSIKGKWNMDVYATGQYTISDLLPLPNLILRGRFYYKNHVLKKALLLNLGFDVYYNTAYKAPNYMPATGQFFLQNSTPVGNYPYIDVFLNAQIKKARIFLKVENVFSGLLGQTYLQYPRYPMNDRTFRLGINWRFFN